jgi:hypothetical protein
MAKTGRKTKEPISIFSRHFPCLHSHQKLDVADYCLHILVDRPELTVDPDRAPNTAKEKPDEGTD